jgi:hypothetical protein
MFLVSGGRSASIAVASVRRIVKGEDDESWRMKVLARQGERRPQRVFVVSMLSDRPGGLGRTLTASAVCY